MQPATVLTLTLGLSAAAFSPAAATAPSSPVPPPAACALPDGPLPTRTRAVFVLDTSGSMRGLGDGRADIFERVKAELNRYVRQTRPDRVELLTFDAGLRTRQGFDRPAGTAGWNAALGALKADGNNTYLYRSLRAALEPLRDGAQYASTVFVLTDGIDNDGLRPFTAAQALAAFTGRGPFDRLHYLALGTQIPADARQALQASDYADGLTLPLNRVPALDGPGLGSGLLRVNGLGAVAVPLAEGTRVEVSAQDRRWGLRPEPAVVTGGTVTLRARGDLPHGAAALLCASGPGTPAAGSVGTRPQRVLLRLNTQSPLTLLNPGADTALRRGEDAVLRYRAARGVSLRGLRVTGLPAGLSAQISGLPGAREFAVRITNRFLPPSQTVRPQLALPGNTQMALPAIQGRKGGRAPYAVVSASGRGGTATVTTPKPPQQNRPQGAGGRDTPGAALGWLAGLGVLALAGLAAWLLARRGRAGRRPGGRSGAAPTRWSGPAGPLRRRRPTLQRPVAHAEPPAVEGIEYSGGRVLSLVTSGGDVTGVPIPLGGLFDLGQLARVPHLSGLRAEQHRDGLQILRIPADLEVSQGTRLVRAGDVVRPGTLLGVAVGRVGRAPQPPLGSLAGLGLPLTLRHDAASVRAAGPYGQHTVILPAGPSDLGTAFRAPALDGLKVTLSGSNLLLVATPPSLRLRRSGETAPLQPGSYLPDLTLVDLPDS
ncbi:vWA domain-containing protein [Deinococcus aerolatus]|nr:vWA domain-containing protein [Deinococcus aerolatus]